MSCILAGAEGRKSAFGGFALLDGQNLVDFGTAHAPCT